MAKVAHAALDCTAPSGRASQALYVRRTLRAGQRVEHDGSVVIFGDVNAGAEVLAGGDVLVFGHLRGVVHAGASGCDTACVCAWRLEPVQLRIGRLIARPPDQREQPPDAPEVARIEGGQVVIERIDRPDDGRLSRG